MKIVCISDTHMMHRDIKLPPGDVLIHAGDATGRGTEHELAYFFGWLAAQNYRRKIFVPGNHDQLFETRSQYAHSLVPYDVTCLLDSGVTIDGIKFWGSPWQPEFMNWAFNLPRGKPLVAKWALIPDDTNVLITHGPPFGIGDNTPRVERVGCVDLRKRIEELKELKLHVFGHIHAGHGVYGLGQATLINACSCDDMYSPVNKPIVTEIF